MSDFQIVPASHRLFAKLQIYHFQLLLVLVDFFNYTQFLSPLTLAFTPQNKTSKTKISTTMFHCLDPSSHVSSSIQISKQEI